MTETEKMVRRTMWSLHTFVRLRGLGIDLSERVRESVHQFVQDAEHDPDTTLVATKVKGAWVLAIITRKL